MKLSCTSIILAFLHWVVVFSSWWNPYLWFCTSPGWLLILFKSSSVAYGWWPRERQRWYFLHFLPLSARNKGHRCPSQWASGPLSIIRSLHFSWFHTLSSMSLIYHKMRIVDSVRTSAYAPVTLYANPTCGLYTQAPHADCTRKLCHSSRVDVLIESALQNVSRVALTPTDP